jgi:TatA/E family protein of Tat protein translocase
MEGPQVLEMCPGLESPTHLIIVLVIVLLLFGAKRVPELAKGLGAGIGEFKKGAGKAIATLDWTRPPTTAGAHPPLASVHAGLIHSAS